MMASNLDNDFYYILKRTGFENKEKFRLNKRDYKNRHTCYTRYYTNQKQYRSKTNSELNSLINIGNYNDFMMPSKIHTEKGKPFCCCCSEVRQNKIYSNNFVSYV